MTPPSVFTKEAIEQWAKVPGEVRGMGLKTNLDYVFEMKGPEALKRVEDAMARMGYPITRSAIQAMAFYPFVHSPVVEIGIQDTLGFSEQDFYEMGRYSTKVSLFLKIMAKYFLSVQAAITYATKMWNEYYTRGHIQAVEVNDREKRIILRILDFETTDPGWNIIRGYFSQTAQMIVGNKVQCLMHSCKDIQLCMEFVITW